MPERHFVPEEHFVLEDYFVFLVLVLVWGDSVLKTNLRYRFLRKHLKLRLQQMLKLIFIEFHLVIP